MGVKIAKNLKRVKTFINKYGEEIPAEQFNQMGHVMGGAPGANRLPGIKKESSEK